MDSRIEALRHQHERGRNLIAEAEKSLPGYEKDEIIHTETLLENLASYASLLRHHIHREENDFYPHVAETFTKAEDQAILDEFEKETQKAGETVYNESQNRVKALGMLLET